MRTERRWRVPTDDDDDKQMECLVCGHKWWGVVASCPKRADHDKILAERERVLEEGRKLAESGLDAPPTEEDKK
jgi:hypothetical protein